MKISGLILLVMSVLSLFVSGPAIAGPIQDISGGKSLHATVQFAANDDLEAICAANPSSALCSGYTGAKNNSENPTLKLLRNVTNILSFFAGVLAVFFVIYGGFKYITSSGDPQKAASGRQTLIYALIGVIVVVISRQLILFVLNRLLT